MDVPPAPHPERKLGWYHSPASLLVSFLVVGPFMLPLVWTHPKMSRRAKMLWTLGAAAVTGGLVWGMAWAVGSILDYYEFIFQL